MKRTLHPSRLSETAVDRRRPLAIDLFAGAGGLSLGFEQAGFDVVAAVEYDPIHAATHTYNFPNCATLARSIIHVSGADIRRASGIGDAPIDVVFGGPPCQGFSLIGKRALDDPRNLLVREFVRIIRELRPRFFVFENVKGLTVGKHRRFLEEIVGEFESIGYRLQLPWRVLNAYEYGVPQNRQRLFLLGGRSGQRLPYYPAPLTRCAGETELGILPLGPNCQDALGDLPDSDEYEALKGADEIELGSWQVHSAYAAELRCKLSQAWHFGYRRVWDPALLTSSQRTHHTEISRRRFSQTRPGEVEPISRFFRLAPEGVANTLRAGTDSARGAFTSPRPIHYCHARCITVREMARLHGFPDWFRFHVTKWHGARQVGNAVPPPLARAVAEELIASMGVDSAMPSGPELALGDSSLLRLGMSEAARYFNVEVPIGRRDRKNGMKKRKQWEIETTEAP